MKRLSGREYGVAVKEAETFRENKEETLCDLQLLDEHSPHVLLNTMVFLIGSDFPQLRSGNVHRNLRFEQLTLKEATEKSPEKLVYCSFCEKNNQVGLEHRLVKWKIIEHYANDEMSWSICIKKKFVARCLQPVAGSFYLNPRRKFVESDKGTWLNI